jgi:hypothetical protein
VIVAKWSKQIVECEVNCWDEKPLKRWLSISSDHQSPFIHSLKKYFTSLLGWKGFLGQGNLRFLLLCCPFGPFQDVLKGKISESLRVRVFDCFDFYPFDHLEFETIPVRDEDRL